VLDCAGNSGFPRPSLFLSETHQGVQLIYTFLEGDKNEKC
jgi:hypothetical protein